MSSAALVDGRIKDYDDIYKRDGKVIAALLDKSPKATKMAASQLRKLVSPPMRRGRGPDQL